MSIFVYTAMFFVKVKTALHILSVSCLVFSVYILHSSFLISVLYFGFSI